MTTPVTAYIGLGSNLEDPAAQLRRALDALARHPALELLAVSPFYRTDPVGPPGQPDFVNAVAAVRTALPAHGLLRVLQDQERAQGRTRELRWGPRTLDLDLLLFGQTVCHDAELTLPHPGLHERAFVLYPLRDVAPHDLVVPGHGPLADLLIACNARGVNRLEQCPGAAG